MIIVRDGRDTVESAIRSFDWSFRHCAHIWRDAAEKIRRYLQTEDGRTALLVRYEDLITNCDHEVRRILDYLELDPAEFDFEAAGQLPVRGSSDLRTEPAGKVHWSPVARSESFNPLSRWHGWSDAAKQQFLWWAGDQLAYFGYLDGSERKPTRLGPRLVGLLRDVRYSLRLGKSITKRIDWLRERTRLRRR